MTNETFESKDFKVVISPNPAQDFIAIQTQMAEKDYKIELIDELGKIIRTSKILQGSTLSIIEIETLYKGVYFVNIYNDNSFKSYKVIIE